jgi:hypothetical protein
MRTTIATLALKKIDSEAKLARQAGDVLAREGNSYCARNTAG